ncbi:MAG: histidine kinase [Candidatus Obscuribacterales bacterium]|nr:histidine kinase [Steroidobacteraceae bacterium]
MATQTSDIEERYRHPLESIPRFRRIPPSIVRDLLYTLIMCGGFVLTFSSITLITVPTVSFTDLVYRTGVFSLTIGYSIHLLSFLAHRIVARWFDDGTRRNYAIAGVAAPLIGGVAGYIAASHVFGVGMRLWSGMIVAVLWTTALMTGMVMAQRRQMMSDLAFERERTARVEAERLMTAARLKLLQAQIEPHFLFNTLAGVSSLIEADPRAARKMVDELCIFLRAALDSTRRPTATLQRELEVIEAYLSVLKVRMGSRLEYSIEAPHELLDTEVPSMILQPLVENAVQHGIDSQLEGGKLCVRIARDGDRLRMSVLDDGEGFASSVKESVGMGTVRERIDVLFGARGSLRVARESGWTHVIVEIPFTA